MFGYFAINAVFISFAYILVFVLEKIFGFTSRVTLVELSDINHPLLKELSEECPGTFQHSMALSNLATAAANRIGAKVQLVRAGALYHDIGKLSNPAFFTENQHGVNPHDALDPMQSAKIVIGHVTEGLKRAEKAKLPMVLRDFITQHHGAGTARYFYTTYCNSHPDEIVDPAPFTYPGPNPTSREASILMMADAVEAASRSLSDHSREAIATLVNRVSSTPRSTKASTTTRPYHSATYATSKTPSYPASLRCSTDAYPIPNTKERNPTAGLFPSHRAAQRSKAILTPTSLMRLLISLSVIIISAPHCGRPIAH